MAPFKQCIIINRKAGSASQQAEIEEALDRLAPCELYETRLAGDAQRLARQAVDEGFQRVVAAGGDGTLNEVLNGLAGGFGRVELGLLPLGTANDFARAIFVPADIVQAVELLIAGETRRVDVARLIPRRQGEARHFLNVSAGGFSTLVDEKLERKDKDWWRSLAYAFSAVKALPELERYEMRVAFDGEPPLEISAYNVVVANGSYVGGGILVAPQARLDDGLLDVVIFRAMPMSKVALLVPKTLLGQHLDDEDVLYRQVRRLALDSEPSFDLNTDGEVTGSCPAEFEVLPSALDVVVGRAGEEAG